MTLKKADFEVALDRLIEQAREQGRSFLDVVSGDLHRLVGVYPLPNHRMPVCCRAMRDRMRPGDRVLQEPPSGQGATLVVRYVFGR